MKAGLIPARRAARKLVADRIQTPWIREAMLARVDAMRLGEGITHGDLAVSSASATAVGSSPKTWQRTHHLSIKVHDEVVKELLALLKED